jgi:hypothetical protein
VVISCLTTTLTTGLSEPPSSQSASRVGGQVALSPSSTGQTHGEEQFGFPAAGPGRMSLNPLEFVIEQPAETPGISPEQLDRLDELVRPAVSLSLNSTDDNDLIGISSLLSPCVD